MKKLILMLEYELEITSECERPVILLNKHLEYDFEESNQTCALLCNSHIIEMTGY
jgi:hypothetical protein